MDKLRGDGGKVLATIAFAAGDSWIGSDRFVEIFVFFCDFCHFCHFVSFLRNVMMK